MVDQTGKTLEQERPFNQAMTAFDAIVGIFAIDINVVYR